MAEVIGLVLVVILVLFAYTKKFYNRVDEVRVPFVENQAGEPKLSQSDTSVNAFQNLDLSAHSAIVINTKTGKIIYEKNRQDILPLASLTKLMTALTAVEILPQDSTIQIAREYLQEEDVAGLFTNEKWKTSDLMAFTLVASSNVGARAIATAAGALLQKNATVANTNADPRQVFIKEMNSKANKLGLDSMTFYNDNGLDVSTERAGAYGSAEDVAHLAEYILENHPELLEPTTHTKISFVSKTNFIHKVKNTNQTVEFVPGIIGSKTGYTDLAQGNLVVTFAPGLDGPYVAVALGSTFDGRFSDVTKLINATLASE